MKVLNSFLVMVGYKTVGSFFVVVALVVVGGDDYNGGGSGVL